MRKDLGVKTYLYPQPVLMIVTYNEDNTVNVMNAAWGAISDYDQISICLALEHKTVKNILERKAFCVSMATLSTMTESDYFGIVSGNNIKDKLSNTKFTYTKSNKVDAPLIDQYPLTIECKLISLNNETGICLGKIVNVSCDESILNGNKINIEKLQAISFDPSNNAYLLLDKTVGKAFFEGKKIIKKE